MGQSNGCLDLGKNLKIILNKVNKRDTSTPSTSKSKLSSFGRPPACYYTGNYFSLLIDKILSFPFD